MPPLASPLDFGISAQRVRRLLRLRSAVMLREISRVRKSSEVEAIHDLRVATRRLQEALDFFEPCLPPAPLRRLLRRARRIRRGLGEIRNADVTLDMVTTLRRRLGSGHSRGLKVLRDRLQVETAALRRLATGREGMPVPGARKRCRLLLAGIDGHGVLHLDRRSQQILQLRVAEILRRIPPALAGGADALHRLRITVKRYRYSLEILEELGWRRAHPRIAAARTIQEELGRVHDLDVLSDLIRRTRLDDAGSLLDRISHDRLRRLATIRGVLQDFRPEEILVTLKDPPASRR